MSARTCSTWLLAAAAYAVSGAAFATGLQFGHRPEIGAVDAPKNAKAGQAVKITVSAKKDGSSGCGLLIKFGDGTDHQMKINRDEAKFPVTLEHTYKKNGRYTVSASGKDITTNKACKGSASSVVQVGPVVKQASAKK
jgi:hypothetical protein